jgi:hypothetical protein
MGKCSAIHVKCAHIIFEAEHITEFFSELCECVVLKRVSDNVDAAHVAVNLVRLVAVAELDHVELAIGVDGVAAVSGGAAAPSELVSPSSDDSPPPVRRSTSCPSS